MAADCEEKTVFEIVYNSLENILYVFHQTVSSKINWSNATHKKSSEANSANSYYYCFRKCKGFLSRLMELLLNQCSDRFDH